jgi:glycosyltransferase involved in cell wall biosynthesis
VGGTQTARSVKTRDAARFSVLPAVKDIRTYELGERKILRVLFVTLRDVTHPSSGGAARAVFEIAKRLATAGHGVTILSTSSKREGGLEGISSGSPSAGVRVVRRGRTLFPHPSFVWFVLSHHRNFDIIVEEIGAGHLPFCLYPLVGGKVAVLMHQKQDVALRAELGRLLGGVVAYVEDCLLRLYGQRGARFVVPTNSVKESLTQIGVPGEHIFVVPLGVEACRESPPSERPNTLLYLGKLRRYKGAHYAVEVLDRVIRQGIDANLVIAGRRGSRGYELWLRRLVRRRGLDRYVTFALDVSESSKRELLRRSKILLIPSAQEGFGLVVLEANLSGVPAVGFDVTGLRDVIKDGVNGFVVPPGSVEELCEHVVGLLRDRILYAAMSGSAAAHAHGFSWERTAAEFERILLDRHKRLQSGRHSLNGI